MLIFESARVGADDAIVALVAHAEIHDASPIGAGGSALRGALSHADGGREFMARADLVFAAGAGADADKGIDLAPSV